MFYVGRTLENVATADFQWVKFFPHSRLKDSSVAKKIAVVQFLLTVNITLATAASYESFKCSKRFCVTFFVALRFIAGRLGVKSGGWWESEKLKTQLDIYCGLVKKKILGYSFFFANIVYYNIMPYKK